MKTRDLRQLERRAISLVAILILVPLAAHLIEKLIRRNWNYNDFHNPQDPSVIIAALTLGVLIFQAWIFRKQALVADLQRKLMSEQADISRNQAILENRRFVAEYRPRLTVRQTSNGLHYVDEKAAEGLGWQRNSFFTTFSVTNIGGTECKITESRVELLVLPKVLTPMQFARSSSNSLGCITFSAGQAQSEMVFVTGVLGQSINDVELSKFVGPTATHYLAMCGTILYVDENGGKRCTAFWREYDWEHGGFRKSEDSNVEYED